MVDGEVVADEEEVAELDLLLPQQALTPRDLPHLGQDLKPITISITIIRVKGKMNLLKDSVLGLLREVVLVGDAGDRLQGKAVDERLPCLLEHPET